MRRKKINQLKQFEQQQLEIHREEREAETEKRQEEGAEQRKKSNLKEILINELRLKQQEQS